MTTPTLKLLNKLWPKIKTDLSETFKVLFSFGRSRTGKVMLNLVQTFFGDRKEAVDVTGMHMTIGESTSFSDAELFRRRNFEPIEKYASELNISIKEHYEITENATESIIQTSDDLYSDLLLVGAGLDLSSLPEDIELNKKHNDFKSLFRISFSKASGIFNIAQFFKNKTEIFVNDTHCSVGIVVNRGLTDPARSILAVNYKKDTSYTRLLNYLTSGVQEDSEIKRLNHKDLMNYNALEFSAHDLLILPYDLWKDIVDENPEFITLVPTTLLLYSRLKSTKGIKQG